MKSLFSREVRLRCPSSSRGAGAPRFPSSSPSPPPRHRHRCLRYCFLGLGRRCPPDRGFGDYRRHQRHTRGVGPAEGWHKCFRQLAKRHSCGVPLHARNHQLCFSPLLYILRSWARNRPDEGAAEVKVVYLGIKGGSTPSKIWY